MVTFRNNNRRPNFRRNDRNFKSNGDRSKFKSNFSSNDSFQRKVPGRNNHNASKLIEKYNDLAREALANEDKILSENYFQHADHFTRILNEQEKNRPVKIINEPPKVETKDEKSTIKTEEKKELEKQAANN
jgi:hypothetical protein|tara:strand:- start:553 stop:945 length:393 start_codon:yes stop_codon:yes gene_type:complete